jgi:hypothetical protein
MNTDIVSIEDASIEELLEKTINPLSSEPENLLTETLLPVNRRFGVVDLWKIRSTKRYFRMYR